MILLKTCESRLRASRIKWWVMGGGLWDGMAGRAEAGSVHPFGVWFPTCDETLIYLITSPRILCFH